MLRRFDGLEMSCSEDGIRYSCDGKAIIFQVCKHNRRNIRAALTYLELNHRERIGEDGARI